jgi:DNA-binding CsgD family transcriptional regulator
MGERDFLVSSSDSEAGEGVFVGRRNELAVMAECARRAAGGVAQVVWLEGDAGVGKTALLRQALQELPREFSVVRAEADELSADVPMLVASQLGGVTSASPFAAGLELLDRLSALEDAGPVSVVAEDIHWADAPSRQTLLTTARRLGQDRVIMFVTARPGGREGDGWHRFSLDPQRCRRIMLGPLSAGEVAELARGRHIALGRRDAQRLRDHTGGHPLYVRTLLDELTARQLTNPDGELSAPRSLASTAMARLASLPAESADLAYALAVANQRTPLAQVAAIAGVDNGAAALDDLLKTGFVTWSPSEPQTPVQFSHPLYRAAVYEDLAPTKRQQLHRRAAVVLGSDTALAHRVAAADGVDDALARELATASQAEMARGSDDQAATYLLWASSLDPDRQLAEDHLLQAAYLLVTGWRTARARALRPGVTACAASPLRSLVLGLLAKDEGDGPAAQRWLRDAITTAGGPGPDGKALPRALAELALLVGMLGQGAEAVELAERAIGLRPREADTEQVAWAALSIGEAMRLGGDPLAGLRRLLQRLPQPPGEVTVADTYLLVIRGTLGYYAGQVTAPAADLRAAITLARKGPLTAQLPRAHMHLAQILVNVGQWDEALAQCRVGLSLNSDEREMWIQAQTRSVLASLLAYRGQQDEAAEQLRAARQANDAAATVESAAMLRCAEAALARARGDSGKVIEALMPLTRQQILLVPLAWWSSLIVACLAQGVADAAATLLEDLQQAAGQRDLDMRARLTGLRAQIEAARGRAGPAEALFRESMAGLGDGDPLLDRVQIQHAYGRLLLRTGRRRAAAEQFRAARDLLWHRGAEPFRAEVDADLAACGIRPGPPNEHSWLRLTDREGDVATLATRGLTNREIATELYVSTKAVEYHLGNIYAKLGIRSRRQLRDIASA